MILLLDTSTPLCRLTLIDGESRFESEWQADRTLAKGLLRYLADNLLLHAKSWEDITAIGVFQGPGSFTGLRIGLTVLNTMADSQKLPIVGGRGQNWQAEVLEQLERGHNDLIVLPFYGSEAHITQPRK
ncbi:MAG: tRNA (adenosine(37)-N6)-threonylcarbamoyltransferase complex dimerization subunit type 1 TsaB [Candidatus Saccharibacteria bacterium]